MSSERYIFVFLAAFVFVIVAIAAVKYFFGISLDGAVPGA